MADLRAQLRRGRLGDLPAQHRLAPARTRPRLPRVQDVHRAQDIVPMLNLWSSHAGVGQVDVVTVPGPEAARDELWKRFCTAIAGAGGVDQARTSTQDNSSLGYASCDYLRRLNAYLVDVPPRRYRKGIRPLTREVLGPLRQLEGRPELDAKGAAVRARTEREGPRGRDKEGPPGHRLPRGALCPRRARGRLGGGGRTARRPRAASGRRRLGPVRRARRTKAGSRPDELEAVVADGARLLRRAHRWNR